MTWEYEEKAWANGYGSVCGVDEAGRGPVAGPVCAAAVILPAGIVIEGLNDSKKLSEKKKREKLFDEITANALAWSVSLVDERVIDEINILQATYRAMKQAVDGPDTSGGFCLCGRQSLAGTRAAARVRGLRRCKNPVCCGSVHHRQGNARPPDAPVRGAVPAVRL